MIKIRDKRIMADYTDNFERLWRRYCASHTHAATLFVFCVPKDFHDSWRSAVLWSSVTSSTVTNTFGWSVVTWGPGSLTPADLERSALGGGLTDLAAAGIDAALSSAGLLRRWASCPSATSSTATATSASPVVTSDPGPSTPAIPPHRPLGLAERIWQ